MIIFSLVVVAVKIKTQPSIYCFNLHFYDRFVLINCLSSHRSTLIQDIQRGNSGCKNLNDGRNKYPLQLPLEKVD